ncbi:MAG: Ig-like domain-containing protein [Anaerolineaceae bacterium]|nr:Ig-like domain-containing protein [Anaerolineaceae bacterium]
MKDIIVFAAVMMILAVFCPAFSWGDNGDIPVNCSDAAFYEDYLRCEFEKEQEKLYVQKISAIDRNSKVEIVQPGETKIFFIGDGNIGLAWNSSDPSAADVSSEGVITGIGIGAAEITAVDANGTKVFSCKIYVATADENRCRDIARDDNERQACDQLREEYEKERDRYIMRRNGLAEVAYPETKTVHPGVSGGKAASWSSSDPACSVTRDGVISAAGNGVSMIKSLDADGGELFSCTVFCRKDAVPD